MLIGLEQIITRFNLNYLVVKVGEIQCLAQFC